MMNNQLTMPFKQVLLQVKWFFIKLLNLFLVASVRAAHGDFSHAMILDNVRNSQFIFKNTYSNNKKYTIPIDAPNSPDELFFVHIDLTARKLAEVMTAQLIAMNACDAARQRYNQRLHESYLQSQQQNQDPLRSKAKKLFTSKKWDQR